MKNLIIQLLTFIAFTSWSQYDQPKEIGIGFTIATNPYEFEDLSIPKNLFKNKELNITWISKDVFPYFYKPDYGLYHFICLEKTPNYYKILVNDNEIGYLPNDSNFYFKSWDALILNKTVARLTDDNPIREESNNNSEIVENHCEFDQFQVIDIIQKDNEYWIQISFSKDCEDYREGNSEMKYGWIKWRTDNKLLVDIMMLC
jgi:hypothetical protein